MYLLVENQMCNREKIDLENAIFARAYETGTSVYGVMGALVSNSADRKLEALLYVYNAFFRAENQRQFCEVREVLATCRMYRMQSRYAAGLGKNYREKELNFELVLMGKL